MTRRRAAPLLPVGFAAALLFPRVGIAAEAHGPTTTSTLHTRTAAPVPEDRGFTVRSADGVNTLRLLGLLQLELSHDWIDRAPDTDAFSVHRARIGVVGSVLRKDLRYTFVADFADATPRMVFANLDHTLVPARLAVRVGQFKVPFSRSFLTPGSDLSMIDRPMTVGPRAFGDNADVGVMLHDGGANRVEYAAGVFNGAGPNVVPNRIHPLLAVRVGYKTRGTTPYSESDLDGGAPRFGIAAAAIIDADANGESVTSTSGVADMMFMARGFSLASAVYARTRQDGPRGWNQSLDAVGHHTHLGYVIARRVEPVVRYAVVLEGEPHATHDVAGGLNVFFLGHAIKWQTSVSARLGTRDGRSTADLHLASQLGVAF